MLGVPSSRCFISFIITFDPCRNVDASLPAASLPRNANRTLFAAADSRDSCRFNVPKMERLTRIIINPSTRTSMDFERFLSYLYEKYRVKPIEIATLVARRVK